MSLTSLTTTQEISTMLKFHWIAGATILSLGSIAFAQVQPATAPLTRAEVRAELARAQAAGELAWHSYAVVAAPAPNAGAQGRAFAGPGLTREQVRAELMRARAAGEIAWHEYSVARMPAPNAGGAQGRAFAGPGLTREQVRAELMRARASGELERPEGERGQ
jgi:hypothetical protein